MRFAQAFVQHYFLEIDPRYYDQVSKSLHESYRAECEKPSEDEPMEGSQGLRIGPWRLFAWLDPVSYTHLDVYKRQPQVNLLRKPVNLAHGHQ